MKFAVPSSPCPIIISRLLLSHSIAWLSLVAIPYLLSFSHTLFAIFQAHWLFLYSTPNFLPSQDRIMRLLLKAYLEMANLKELILFVWTLISCTTASFQYLFSLFSAHLAFLIFDKKQEFLVYNYLIFSRY